jgi:hypothetical protein
MKYLLNLVNVSVCAWCRSICYQGFPIKVLSDLDYKLVESHGICSICKDEMLRAKR